MVYFKPTDTGYVLLLRKHVFSVDFCSSRESFLSVDGGGIYGDSHSVSAIISFLAANYEDKKILGRMVNLLKAISQLSYKAQHVWISLTADRLGVFNKFYEDVATSRKYWKVRKLLRDAGTDKLGGRCKEENKENHEGFFEAEVFEAKSDGYRVVSGAEYLDVEFVFGSYGRRSCLKVMAEDVPRTCLPLQHHETFVRMAWKEGLNPECKIFMRALKLFRGETQAKWMGKLCEAYQQGRLEEFLSWKFKGQLGKMVEAEKIIDKGFHILDENTVLVVPSNHGPVCKLMVGADGVLEKAVMTFPLQTPASTVSKLLSKNRNAELDKLEIVRTYTSALELLPEERGKIVRVLEKYPELEKFKTAFQLSALLGDGQNGS